MPRGVRPLLGTRCQRPMLGHVPEAGAVGEACPMQYFVHGPHDNGGTNATWPLRPSLRRFSTWDTDYLVIPYTHLPEPVTVVREMAGVAVEDCGTDSLELDGGGGSVGWRWSQASSQACCSVVNGGSSASISQFRQRGRRHQLKHSHSSLLACSTRARMHETPPLLHVPSRACLVWGARYCQTWLPLLTSFNYVKLHFTA